jgi:Zn-dependent protease with chaperone function
MNKIYLLSFFLLSSILSGCVTNPMTGRSQLSLISEDSVINKSASMYSDMVIDLDKKGKISQDDELIKRVQGITNRLVERAILYRPETSNWDWQVNVVDEPEIVNASCMPGGKMVLYTGLINKIEPSDDELAQVMGHEISHALANHGAEKMSNQILGKIAVAAVAVAVATQQGSNNQSVRTAETAGSLAAAAFITLPNSRGAETEADKLGIELAAQAGYDPAAAITLWHKMADESGQKSRGDFWSTHPSPPNRIEALTTLQEPMNKIYLARRDVYNETYIAKHQYVKMGGQPFANSSNVTILNEGATSLTTNEYIDPTQALAFYSPEYQAFQDGTLELTCTNCGFNFYRNQSEFKILYDKKDWRGLVQNITKSNYQFDLAYLYLGFAAEGLGLIEPAKKYFTKALELSSTEDFSCADAKFIKCNNFDVKSLANKF